MLLRLWLLLRLQTRPAATAEVRYHRGPVTRRGRKLLLPWAVAPALLLVLVMVMWLGLLLLELLLVWLLLLKLLLLLLVLLLLLMVLLLLVRVDVRVVQVEVEVEVEAPIIGVRASTKARVEARARCRKPAGQLKREVLLGRLNCGAIVQLVRRRRQPLGQCPELRALCACKHGLVVAAIVGVAAVVVVALVVAVSVAGGLHPHELAGHLHRHRRGLGDRRAPRGPLNGHPRRPHFPAPAVHLRALVQIRLQATHLTQATQEQLAGQRQHRLAAVCRPASPTAVTAPVVATQLQCCRVRPTAHHPSPCLGPRTPLSAPSAPSAPVVQSHSDIGQ